MKIYFAGLFLLLAAPAPLFAQFQSGRSVEGRETLRLGLSYGSVFGLDGEVRETTRPYYELTGVDGAPPENYSWDELGFDDEFSTYGLFLEKMWRFATLHTRLFHGTPQLSGTADRDYYLGVEHVSYNGRDYEYLKIPRGTEYTGDLDIYTLSLGLRITPFSIGNDDHYVEFTPWLHLGFLAFAGDYVIDAGPARGVVQYERPPRDYVEGGRATGVSGLLVPEFGLGGEFRFYLTEAASLYLMGNLGLLKFDGSTGDFGISSRNEKNVEIDYLTVSARIMLEQAIHENINLLVGLEWQSWTADAESRATAKTAEEIEAIREKYDKEIAFEMNTVAGFVGLSF